MPPLCTECPLCARPGRVEGWLSMDGDVPKKDTQDRFLAKKPYKGSDLHSFTACFLHHSEAIHSLCYFAIRGLALLGSVLLSGCRGRSLHLPEFFFLSHKEVNLTVLRETPALRLESFWWFPAPTLVSPAAQWTLSPMQVLKARWATLWIPQWVALPHTQQRVLWWW